MSLCIGVGTPPGVLIMGLLGDAIGIQWSITLNALVCIAISLPTLFLTPLITRPSPRAPNAPTTTRARAS